MPQPAASTKGRAAVLARRYYPFAIGVAFLGVVVGLFPSTVPTNTLGYVPRVTLPVPAPGPPASGPATPPTASSPQVPSVPAVPAVPEVPSAQAAGAPVTASSVTSGSTSTSPVAPPTPPATSIPAPGSSPPPPSGTGRSAAPTTEVCPLPLPAEPLPPSAAELIEIYAAAGPFGPEATAGAPALAPLIPVVAPLFPLAGTVAAGKNGSLLSDTLVEIANLEDDLSAPFASEINAFTPGAVDDDEKLFRELGPLLSLAQQIPDLGCVGDVEMAAGATVAPEAYPGAMPLSTYAAPSSAAARHVAVLSTSWADGLTPAFVEQLDALLAQGTPVEVRLVDDAPATAPAAAQTDAPAGGPADPPAGPAAIGSAFAAWVSSVMGRFPGVEAWEIDPSDRPSAAPGTVAGGDPAAEAAALGDALRVAVTDRQPGQLIGVGLPTTGPAPWWTDALAGLVPAVRSLVNFVGFDSTAQGPQSPAGLGWVVTGVRRQLGSAGLAHASLFVIAGTDASESLAAQSQLAAQDAEELRGLGVGLLSWSSPTTLDGGLAHDPSGAVALLNDLARS